MTSTQHYTSVDVLSRTFELLQAGLLRVGLAFALMAGGGVVIDSGMLGEDGSAASNLPLIIVTLVAQYVLVRGSLSDIDRNLPSVARFGPFVLLGIVSTIAILVGLVLLVVPGILLLVRWWIAVPLLLQSDKGAFDALRESWRATEGRFWPLLGAVALIWVPAVIAIIGFIVFAVVAGKGDDDLTLAVVINVVLNAAMIASWHSTVAVFSYSAGGHERVSEVFA